MKTIIITPEIEEAVSRMHSDDEIAAFFLALMHRTSEHRKVGAPFGNRNAAKNNSKQFKTIEEKETDKETEKEKKQKNKDKETDKEKEGREMDNTALRFVPPKLEDIKSFILGKRISLLLICREHLSACLGGFGARPRLRLACTNVLWADTRPAPTVDGYSRSK